MSKSSNTTRSGGSSSTAAMSVNGGGGGMSNRLVSIDKMDADNITQAVNKVSSEIIEAASSVTRAKTPPPINIKVDKQDYIQARVQIWHEDRYFPRYDSMGRPKKGWNVSRDVLSIYSQTSRRRVDIGYKKITAGKAVEEVKSFLNREYELYKRKDGSFWTERHS